MQLGKAAKAGKEKWRRRSDDRGEKKAMGEQGDVGRLSMSVRWVNP